MSSARVNIRDETRFGAPLKRSACYFGGGDYSPKIRDGQPLFNRLPMLP